ncbi:hypothetical protein Leryth_015148 [Lithospermum erythrorhizon]|nr:hypothetical protein Leryth_015148 [Lithospermum erythrorhizon]
MLAIGSLTRRLLTDTGPPVGGLSSAFRCQMDFDLGLKRKQSRRSPREEDLLNLNIMDVSGITDNGCVSERGSCDQVSNEDDEEISSNVVSSQPVRVSPKPWMPFTQLLVVLSRKVSEKDFKLVNRYYGLYKILLLHDPTLSNEMHLFQQRDPTLESTKRGLSNRLGVSGIPSAKFRSFGRNPWNCLHLLIMHCNIQVTLVHSLEWRMAVRGDKAQKVVARRKPWILLQ